MCEIPVFYTVKQIASKMNVNTSMIYALISNGKLSCVRAGNKFLITEESVIQCLDSLKVN